MTTCLTPGCSRDRIASAEGIAYAYCTACERRLLAGSFGPGAVRASAYRSWHARARANILPTMIGGGRPDAPQGAGDREGTPPASPDSGSLRVATATPDREPG